MKAALKVALFGGTFDPIHNAHLIIAREAAKLCGLSRVLFVPASRPPHKARGTRASYADRLRMVEIACERDPRFEASRLEEGPEYSYSIHTIEKARAELMVEIGAEIRGAVELYFLIGADAFAEIRTWHRWMDVVQAVEFIVVSRPGAAYQIPSGARVIRLEDLELPVSSSEIRKNVAAGLTDADLPPDVAAYIRERGIYRF
ncbi:MAG: nicotinate-nucleotide adenylyltransferase [Acidobacteriota bacterium]|nr:nicotinate-nucleotide adenylyltransferase [Acidobacteriota bacterium]